MLKRTIIILIATLAAGTVLAQAFKWVDENGVTNFSDRPHEGAERIQLPSDGRRPPPPQTVSSAAATAEAAPEEAAVFRYESLTIVSPLAEETLWNIEGVLNVSLRLQPALQTGHRIRVYFDGTPRFVNRMSFQIDEVYRGVHNIQVEIVDQAGQLKIRSQTNRFYVHQNTVVTRPRARPQN